MHRRSSKSFLKANPSSRDTAAFTLMELLVVIAIIGILATVGLPAIKGMTKSNAIIAANRQLLDDLGYARLRAIADHTTVYVVFVRHEHRDHHHHSQQCRPADPQPAYTNCYGGQYTTYALASLRSVGDQPGQPHRIT